MSPQDDLRPMGIGDILDATFRLYRNHFATFLLIALVVYVPYALVVSGVEATFEAEIVEAESQLLLDEEIESFEDFEARRNQGGEAEFDPFAADVDFPWGSLLLMVAISFVFYFLVFPLCQGAMVHKISASYLGDTIGAGEAYRRALPRLPVLIGANIVAGILIFIGYLLLIVPGVLATLWLLLVTAAVMLENQGVIGALKRSTSLMKGHLGKGFLLLLVVGVIGWGFNVGVEVVANMVPWPTLFLKHFVWNIALAIILPVQTAPFILLYYDLRIRKEAFDLERLAELLGEPAPEGSQATPGV